jgi:hypothetical protein
LRDRVLGGLDQLTLTPFERSGGGRLERRELVGETGYDELVDPLRLVEIL